MQSEIFCLSLTNRNNSSKIGNSDYLLLIYFFKMVQHQISILQQIDIVENKILLYNYFRNRRMSG